MKIINEHPCGAFIIGLIIKSMENRMLYFGGECHIMTNFRGGGVV